MAKQTINIGAAPNDGTGTPLRTSFDYCNQNFTELYTATGPSGNNIVVPGSATITGDLTVDTSTLKVDAANNRVGVLNTPTVPFEVTGLIAASSGAFQAGTSNGIFSALNNDVVNPGLDLRRWTGTAGNHGTAYIATSTAGDALFYTDVQASNTRATSLRMTLNSTGLGVGGSPLASHLIHSQGPVGIGGTGSGTRTSYISNANACSIYYTDGGASYPFDNFGNLVIQPRTSAGRSVIIATSSAAGTPVERLIVDPTGNVGVGVTPSAWGSNYKVIESAGNAAAMFAGANVNGVQLSSNCYNDNTNWIYKTTGTAARFGVNNSQFQWNIAGSGTAGNAITFTQAMTLDASGRLLVGGTSPFGIPNGAGTSFFPLIQTITTSGSAAVSAFVNDGTNNRRIGLFVDNDNGITGISVGRSGGSAPFVYRDATDERLRIDTFGNFITTVPTTPPTLAANSQMVFNLTSNTNLRISVRGTDGTTRVANITLA